MPIVSGGGAGALIPIFNSKVAGAAVASIDTGATIPSSYKHLLIEYKVRVTNAASVVAVYLCRVNGDLGADYDQGGVQFNGAAVASLSLYAQNQWQCIAPGATGDAHRFSAGQIVLHDYVSTADWKQGIQSEGVMGTGADANMRTQQCSLAWRSTSAINQVTLTGSGGNIDIGSELSIYGLA